MQSQQLLPGGEVLQKEFFSRAKGRNDPAEQMSKAHKHPRILTECALCRLSSKSLILRMHGIMARHSPIS
jgi:hypothetical protein